MAGKSSKLTAKQAAFVREYLVDRNGTQAAIRAGYSARTAQAQAYQLLNHGQVKRAIAAAEGRHAEAAGITAVRVLEELAAIGFADMGHYAEWGGEVRELGEDGKRKTRTRPTKLKDSRKVDTRAVMQVKVNPDGSTTIKLGNKERALRALGDHLGLFDAAERNRSSSQAKTGLASLVDAIHGADVPDMSVSPDTLPDDDDEV